MAYKILVENGVPETQIISMAYTDVAYSDDNPYKGDLYNWPTGPNCYNEPQVDYKGSEASADNFYSILKGDKHRGPVLQTNEDSIIFIFYTGEGAGWKPDNRGNQLMPN